MNKVKEFRKAKKWTQKQLGEASGTSAPTVCYVENGDNCSISTAISIAKALGVTLNDLFPEGGENRGEG